jgi:probable phosphoglycerate mutase
VPSAQRIHLVRHGETEWSRSGRHTGSTDLPLTEDGRRLAERLRPALSGRPFALVLSSPLERARATCELAGLRAQAQLEPDLVEWRYGAYEGLTSDEIRSERPGWSVFEHGAPGGESPEQVGARVDRVLARLRAVQGDAALFAHGHVLRVLAARWLGLPAGAGRHFLLDTGTICILGWYREVPAVERWNAPVA